MHFADVKATVFAGCGGFGLMSCHGRDPFGGGLDLTDANAYAALVNVASVASADPRVTPGDPAHSFLWRKLNNLLAQDGSEGDPMPKGEAIMWQLPPAEELELVRCWIEQGALDN